MKVNEQGDQILTDEGSLIAYKGKRELFSGTHWFVASGLDNKSHAATSTAISGAPGTPRATYLLAIIEQNLQGSA